MFNNLTKKNKILLITAAVLFVIAIPLTIIQSLNPQQIRQRASGEDVSVYFTKKDSALPLVNGSLASGQSDNLSLWIDTNKFGMDVSGGIINESAILRFAKFDTSGTIIMGTLRLIDFTVTAGTVGNGNITITSAKITPPKDPAQQYLSSNNGYSLPYAITAASITPTPTPKLFTCKNQIGVYEGKYICASIINGSIQCPSGFGDYSPSTPEYG